MLQEDITPVEPLNSIEKAQFKERLRFVGVLFNCYINKSTNDLLQPKHKNDIKNIHKLLNVSQVLQNRKNIMYKYNPFQNEMEKECRNNLDDVMNELNNQETLFKEWQEMKGIIYSL